MECPKCQNKIPDISKFCNLCGTQLGSDPHNDRFSLLHNYVPPVLKERILEAGRQIESERRFVTVMFADVSGFTSLSEKLDPETVTMVMNDLFDGLISIIIKYEGLIIDFFGDGILAVFGAPLAHENDPERAIRSAVDMMPYIDQFNKINPHNLPSPLGMHVGIHSGLVVVGNVGNDLRMRYSAVGDTVNLCSRIADHATRGEIYISESTYKLLPGQLNTEPPEAIKVKGKDQPVTVHKLVSIKDEPVADSAAMKKAFIGRKKEKETISQALSGVLEKKAERILVCGEPGVGKSRLKEELSADATSKGFSIFEGKCSGFETKTPYFLWNTLLKDILEIPSEATEIDIKKHLHDRLHSLGINAEEPYLATLLSLRYEEILFEEDQKRKRNIFEAMHRLIDRLSMRQPAVFILEDLHWADRFSRELLEFLMKKPELSPSLFCIIFRPEYTAYKNIMGSSHLINLDRLSEEDTLELIKISLNIEEVPDELFKLIKMRTGGNPFFIEESLKTLIENRFIIVRKRKVKLLSENLESGVPDTVQGVVMARIDRLEGRIRDVLLKASVIGREFSRRLVERIFEGEGDLLSDLRHLKGLDLILEREEGQDFEYLFKHYMIQEVAYNTILINKRKKLHGLIANAIEEIYMGRLKGLYELLAFHYERAEEWQKAAEYYGRAGRKVREIYTEEESKDLFESKEHAMEKIYESKPQKNYVIEITLAVFLALVFFNFVSNSDVFTGMISNIITGLFNNLPQNWGLWDRLELIILFLNGIFLFFILLWLPIWFIFYVVPIFRKIKLIDLMNDRIEITNRKNKRFSILFSDIRLFSLSDSLKFEIGIPRKKAIKSFKYILCDNTDKYDAKVICDADSYMKINFQTLKGGVPYLLGSGTKVIYIMRKSGFGWLKLLFPWLNTIEKSKSYQLSTSNPEEFFDQLYIAYEKWKRINSK